MIIDEFEIFKNNLSTLKETSKDNHDGEDLYMTESSAMVINFDGVKEEYIAGLQVPEAPKSNDALYIGNDSEVVFIEFKNGIMDRKKQYSVRLKIFDSLLIFSDITKVSASYTRNNLKYILVYNESKNPNTVIEKDTVRDSRARTVIAKILIEKKAKQKFIRFDLERFEKLYLKEVYTYTEKEFEDNFVSKLAYV